MYFSIFYDLNWSKKVKDHNFEDAFLDQSIINFRFIWWISVFIALLYAINFEMMHNLTQAQLFLKPHYPKNQSDKKSIRTDSTVQSLQSESP